MSISTLPTTSAVFDEFFQLMQEDTEATLLEIIAEIECDAEDLAHQRDEGIESPIAALFLIAQWHPAARGGILDWFYLPLETAEALGPDATEDQLAEVFEHGGSLFAFRYEGEAPDLDAMLVPASEALNEAISWAEFAFEEEE